MIWCTHRTVPEIASVIAMATQPTPSQRRRLGVVAGARGKSDERFGSDRRDKVRGYVRGPRKATTSGAREALWLVPLHLNQGLRKLSQSFIEPFGFGKGHEL